MGLVATKAENTNSNFHKINPRHYTLKAFLKTSLHHLHHLHTVCGSLFLSVCFNKTEAIHITLTTKGQAPKQQNHDVSATNIMTKLERRNNK
eukprot:m.278804 g.278804  ORF g.278804 m.278804 type:complete len:92 (-) comp97882_c0_seq1:95-370(-)